MTGSQAIDAANDLVRACRDVQDFPYRWPAPPDARSTEEAGAGSCAGKHDLLASRLQHRAVPSQHLFVIGPLAPALWPDLEREAAGLLEVHELLTVATPCAGPLLVDVTWHPAAVAAGLPGLPQGWAGATDTPLAVEPIGPGYAVQASRRRALKEQLRARLYSPEERHRRDEVLAEIAHRASQL